MCLKVSKSNPLLPHLDFGTDTSLAHEMHNHVLSTVGDGHYKSYVILHLKAGPHAVWHDVWMKSFPGLQLISSDKDAVYERHHGMGKSDIQTNVIRLDPTNFNHCKGMVQTIQKIYNLPADRIIPFVAWPDEASNPPWLADALVNMKRLKCANALVYDYSYSNQGTARDPTPTSWKEVMRGDTNRVSQPLSFNCDRASIKLAYALDKLGSHEHNEFSHMDSDVPVISNRAQCSLETMLHRLSDPFKLLPPVRWMGTHHGRPTMGLLHETYDENKGNHLVRRNLMYNAGEFATLLDLTRIDLDNLKTMAMKLKNHWEDKQNLLRAQRSGIPLVNPDPYAVN